MATMPWRSRRIPVGDREYLVLLSYLPLRQRRGIFRLGSYALRILRQLRRTEGVLGYSMRTRMLRLQFWTLSVWEDERALMAFVRAPPHVHAMERVRSVMGPTKFVRWRVLGSALPPTWDDALRRGGGG